MLVQSYGVYPREYLMKTKKPKLVFQRDWALRNKNISNYQIFTRFSGAR
jgi:hypothetical protein